MELVNVADLIIINSKNQIFLARREHYGKYFWSIPGGRCEGRETFEEAIYREIKEELNCAITALKKFKTYNLKKSEKEYVVTYFYGMIKGKIKLNEELLDYRWFDADLKTLERLKFFLNQKEVITDFIKFYNIHSKRNLNIS